MDVKFLSHRDGSNDGSFLKIITQVFQMNVIQESLLKHIIVVIMLICFHRKPSAFLNIDAVQLILEEEWKGCSLYWMLNSNIGIKNCLNTIYG